MRGDVVRLARGLALMLAGSYAVAFYWARAGLLPQGLAAMGLPLRGLAVMALATAFWTPPVALAAWYLGRRGS